MRPALIACVLIAGCGGARPGPAPGLTLEISEIQGGGYVTGCQIGEQLIAARGFGLEWWRLPAEGPPRLLRRRAVARPGIDAPVERLGCVAERVLVVRADGSRIGLEGGDVAWRGEAPQPPGWPVPERANAPPAGSRWAARIEDGRLSVLGSWGRGTRGHDGEFIEWRPAAGAIADAAFDGTYVWAVAQNGLWRWRPSSGLPTPVALPEALGGRPLVEVFRDGEALWVRDDHNRGYPLSVRGPGAVLLAEPGLLREPPPATVSAPLGASLVEGTLGMPGLRLKGDEDEDLMATPPLRGLAPIGGHCGASLDPSLVDALLLAVGDEVRLVGLGRDRRWMTVAVLPIGGPVRRLFLDGDRVILVTVDRGFGIAHVMRGQKPLPLTGCEPG